MSQTFSIPCPACSGSIQFHQVDGLRVGICEQCGGAWFGSGQFDFMVKHGPAALDQLVSLEPTGTHTNHAGGNAMCPACNIPLRPSSYGGVMPIHVSACYQCGGMFIDATSIEAIDANTHNRATSGASSFGQKGVFAAKPPMPSPQAKIHTISNNFLRRDSYAGYNGPNGYNGYDGYDNSNRVANTMIAVDIAANILSFFL